MERQTLDRSQSSYLDQICADLLRCQKIISIYPLEHPRVRASLDDMRQTIMRRAERLDDVVSMETILIEDLANRETENEQVADDYASLARLLKLHLIQEVRFHRDVSNEELYEFSCLLQEDFREAPIERLDRFDPCSWTSIEIWFYTPQDFPDDLAAGETLLGRAAGLRRSDEVEALLKEVPPTVAKRVRQTLVKPACLRKISELRRRIQEMSAPGDAKTDLMASLVRSIVNRIGDAQNPSVEEILMMVDDHIHCIESRTSSPARVSESRTSAPPPPARDDDRDLAPPALLRTLQNESATERVTDLRQVFGVSPSADVTRKLPVEEESDDSEPAAPPVRRPVPRTPQKESDEPLRDLFDRVECDVVAWNESLAKHDQLLRFLQVILDLLLDRRCRDAISRNWAAILESFTQEMNERDFMRAVVREVVDASTGARLVPGGDLLSQLLDAISSTAIIHGVLEEAVIPENQELAIETLDKLIERRPKRALELLMRLHQHPSPAVYEHAEAALISLSRKPALLEAWAREYPGGLVDPPVFSRIVERESPERLIEAFKEFFIHTPPECSLRLLRLITPDLPGVDCILIAAIQDGPPEVHDYALNFLEQACVPVVTGTLIQTVRLNNYQERPSIKEVETALDALSRMDEPKARQFIEDVEKSRSGWLRHEYRREIRDALKRVRERQERN